MARGWFWVVIGTLGCGPTPTRSSVVSPIPGWLPVSEVCNGPARDCDNWYHDVFCSRSCQPFAKPNEEILDCRAVSFGASLAARYPREKLAVLCEFR